MDSNEEPPADVDQIFNFLKEKRKVEESVCQTFKDEMMDSTAVRMASDKDFQALGLQRRGDILALRSFVSSGAADEEKEGKKRKLLLLSKQLGSKSTKKKTSSSSPRGKFQSSEDDNPLPTRPCKKVQIGWQHFRNEENRYVGVRLVNGGGGREVSIPLNASTEEVVDLMKDVFFPDGKSTFGSTDLMTFKLGNFKCEEINEEFTLAKYIAKHKLTKVRLYILTRMSPKPKKKSEAHYSSDDDFDFSTSAFDRKQDTPSGNLTGLLGSSEDRRSLRESQDDEYLESLATDQAKESEKREELLRCQAETERQESLRQARAMRVSDEPDISDPHITVSLRHTTLGVQTRRFRKSGEVGIVYDWVGSLSLTPENFTLSMADDLNLNPTLPIETVDRSMLSMSECNASPAFPDEIVCFQGFGASSEDSLNSTAQSEETMWALSSVSEELPPVLMEGDKVEEVDEEETPDDTSLTSSDSRISNDSPGRSFRQMVLNERRKDCFQKLIENGVKNVWIHRETVLQDLLKVYESSSDIAESWATFSFHGEEGMDLDGIKREAYSIFWKQLLDEYFEGSNTFVPRIGPDIEESMLRAVGRIISHQYVLTGVFPVQINKVFMVAMLCGRKALTDEDLIESFLAYISGNESMEMREVMKECKEGKLTEKSYDFLVDFFSDYQVTKRPSPTNLQATLVQVAKHELLSKPTMAMDIIKEGLVGGRYKELWQCSKEDVFKIYDMMQLTPSRVLSMLAEDPSTHIHKSQLQVFSYLKKYIRGLGREDLGRFLRYITGSPIPVVERIQVTFHAHQLGSLPHPMAHTCAAVLDLPSGGYDSFNDFRKQMNALLDNELSWKFNSL
ncbi:hypothetical protein OS493_012842 [Desmophyllum pertusum]|uniref:HECT domain-containing protein n=1 Tax=Desmophyllum pertusum TaxID=174260 RepID=A0A9W9Z3Y1_9CNID|nr:hypothetical protein OS493_012842 [Desmophyllum pertusum]